MIKLVALLSGIIFSLTSLFAVAAEEQPMNLPGIETVSAEQLIDLAESNDNLVIIDSRKRGDYDKGHLPDVTYLVNTETNAETLGAVASDKSTPLCFYCNGPKCARSGEAAQSAVAAGYTSVYWFRGGIAEWTDKGFPLEH